MRPRSGRSAYSLLPFLPYHPLNLTSNAVNLSLPCTPRSTASFTRRRNASLNAVAERLSFSRAIKKAATTSTQQSKPAKQERMTQEQPQAISPQASAADEKVQHLQQMEKLSEEKQQPTSIPKEEPVEKEATLPTPPPASSAPLAPRLVPRDMDAEEFMKLCVACDEDDALDDPDDPYRIIGNAIDKSPLEARLLYDDFLSGELQQLWPEVPSGVVAAAKKRLWRDGERGKVGERLEELKLDFCDLAFLSEKLGRVFARYDSRDPHEEMASYLPVSRPLSGPPIVLQHSFRRSHWLGLKLLEGAPLPPARLDAWGDQQQRFLNTPLHAAIHRKYSFWAHYIDPEGAGCGCDGNALAGSGGETAGQGKEGSEGKRERRG